MVAPLDSSVMSDFVAQLEPVNALADRSPGFVWRLQDATGVQAYDDPLILINHVGLGIGGSTAAIRL